MEQATVDKTSNSMQLKADFVPMTVLKLQDCQLNNIKAEMAATIKSAPNYFEQAPIVIDAGSINEQLKPFLDIAGLCKLLREFNVVPIGIRGLSQKDAKLAEANGLALLNARIPGQQDDNTKQKPEASNSTQAPKVVEKKSDQQAQKKPKPKSYTKIITKPVRSGAQIYAPGGDLLILAGVNAGAEVIADGNIHIHGPLRGRALAGARGDTSAHIFCQQLNAELIAIGGHYLVSEQFAPPKQVNSMVHIHYSDGKILIDIT